MFGSRRSGWDTKRGACRIVRRTLREEKAVSVHTTNRLLLAYYEKGYKRICEKCHNCQMQANLIHTHPQGLHSMVTPWPFHTWGPDLIGLVNPPSHGYI